MIYTGEPSDWRDLENQVAAVLSECGLQVQSPRTVPLARGNAEVDVWADDLDATPPQAYAVRAGIPDDGPERVNHRLVDCLLPVLALGSPGNAGGARWDRNRRV